MTTDVNNDVLKYFGGVSKLSLRNIVSDFDDLDKTIDIIAKSPYFNIDNFCDLLKESVNDFIVLTLNIQSLNAKFNQLNILLKYLSDNDVFISAICLQETWITESNSNISLFQIPNYELISTNAACSSHSGLAIYLYNTFSYTVRPIQSSSRLWEGMFLDIEADILNKKVTLCNLYRAPKDTNAYLSQFIEEISPIIDVLSRESSNLIYVGDINIDLLKLQTRDKYSEYFDILVNNGMLPHISLPTRFSRRTATLIDHIFCKFPNSKQESSSGILLSDISDHCPAFIVVKRNLDFVRPQKFIQIRTSSDKAYNSLAMYLKSTDILSKLDHDITVDPSHNYSIISECISSACDKHLPIRKVKFHKHKHKHSEWITNGIVRSIKYRDSLYKKVKCLSPDSDEFNVLKLNLKTYNCILKKSIRHAKNSYFHNVFERYKNDTRNTWKTINSILNSSKSKKDFPSFFTISGIEVTNEAQIANHFNKFFVAIGPKLASNLNTTGLPSFESYLSLPTNHSFSFSHISTDYLYDIIKKFDPKPTIGHDGISMKIVKLLERNFIEALTLTINQSLNSGVFPDSLKIAKILPIYKKGVDSIFDNYRPISILPAISKLFERVVYNQLYDYFITNKLLYFSQHGFRKIHSTETASLEFIDRIMQHLDNGKFPIAIFIDLSKAFDTIDHTILLHKLKYYGLKDNELKWFTSYLCNRKQFVSYKTMSSPLLSISTGVPQGSILGPLLFIIYMNDICFSSSKFKAVLYADDTSLESPLCSFNFSPTSNNTEVSICINRELNKIYNWLCVNKLSLNTAKTKYLIFRFPQVPLNTLPKLNLKINNEKIEQTTKFNFLGVTIEETISWKPHTNIICNKISKTIGVMKKVSSFVPKNILLTLYNSLILPHIYYGTLVWGFNTGRIHKLQKRAIRLVSGAKYNAHTSVLFRDLNILHVADVFKYKCLKFYYKWVKNDLPYYFNDMFIPLRNEHPYHTRNQQAEIYPKPKRSLTKKSIRYYIPCLKLESKDCIITKITTHSFDGFSKYVKKCLIDDYDVACTIQNCYICNQVNST